MIAASRRQTADVANNCSAKAGSMRSGQGQSAIAAAALSHCRCQCNVARAEHCRQCLDDFRFVKQFGKPLSDRIADVRT